LSQALLLSSLSFLQSLPLQALARPYQQSWHPPSPQA
jgi:hypothetical protein